MREQSWRDLSVKRRFLVPRSVKDWETDDLVYTSYQTNREAARAPFASGSPISPHSLSHVPGVLGPTFMRPRHFRSACRLVSILRIHSYSDNKYLVREARDDYALNPRARSPRWYL